MRKRMASVGFSWAGSRYPNSSEATGKLEGDSLKVEYDLNMQLSDFENAVYVSDTMTAMTAQTDAVGNA